MHHLLNLGSSPDTQVQILEIEQFLHQHIPLSAAMEVRVTEWDGKHLVLEAALAPNHNHLGTAFGGSLNALATLAGYGAVWLSLDDPTAHVVIRDSAISFRRPVRSDFRAVCHLPSAEDIGRFKRDYAKKGKARLTLKVTVEEEDEVAVEFTGTFVALSK